MDKDQLLKNVYKVLRPTILPNLLFLALIKVQPSNTGVNRSPHFPKLEDSHMKVPTLPLVSLLLLVPPAAQSLGVGQWASRIVGNGQQLDLSKLEDVLVQYIPAPHHTTVVPLGGWSGQNMGFLCNGKISVCNSAVKKQAKSRHGGNISLKSFIICFYQAMQKVKKKKKEINLPSLM